MKLKQRAAQVPVEKIKPSPYFFRDSPAREDLDALKTSMSKIGQIHAGSVVPVLDGRSDGVDYELINAHRRLMAANELGWETFTADIWEFTDEERGDPAKREIAIRQFLAAANMQEPLTPLERAEQYQRVMDVMGMDTVGLAALFDRTEEEILEDLRYIFIDPDVRDELHKPEVATRLGREHLDLVTSQRHEEGLAPEAGNRAGAAVAARTEGQRASTTDFSSERSKRSSNRIARRRRERTPPS